MRIPNIIYILFLSKFKALIKRLSLPLFFIMVVTYLGKEQLTRIEIIDTAHILNNITGFSLTFMILLSLFAVVIMSGYDFIALGNSGSRASKLNWLKVSLLANTSNNIIGVIGFTGSGIRAAMYSQHGMDPEEAVERSSVILPSYSVGLSLLSLFLLVSGYSFTIDDHYTTIAYFCLIIVSLYFFIYILIQRSLIPYSLRKKSSKIVPWTSMLGLTIVSSVEKIAAISVLLLALMFSGSALSFTHTAALYIFSSFIGILSLIPGGWFVFDAVLLIGLSLFGVSPSEALAGLCLFRFSYSFVPWLFALIVSIEEPIGELEKRILPLIRAVSSSWGFFGRLVYWPERFAYLQNLGVLALALMTFFSGVSLIFSQTFIGQKMLEMQMLLNPGVLIGSHYVSIAVGGALIVLSRGIYYRLKQAYVLTVGFLVLGIVTSMLSGVELENKIFALFLILLLWFSRKRFYREAVPFSFLNAVKWGIIATIILSVYWLLGAKILQANLLTGIYPVLKPSQHLTTVLIAAGVTWVILSMITSLKPERNIGRTFDNEEQEKVKEYLQRTPGTTHAHLIFMGDKKIFWGENGKVMIPYASINNKLVALGDPMGSEKYVREALKELRSFADFYAMHPVFYQVSSRFLSLFHELGYRFFKLGEEAIVDLTNFSESGRKMRSLRKAKNRLENSGYTLAVSYPPFSEELLVKMREISDDWLALKKGSEKYFSMGRFACDYIQSSPVVLLKNPEGELKGFVTIVPGYNSSTISADLMRYHSDAPNGTMDAIFLFLLGWAKEQGYTKFSMGMAPLSNVGETSYSFRGERAAWLVYQYFNYWYSFKGLRQYKEKFSPNWEARFLAYPAHVSTPRVLLEVILLINGFNRSKLLPNFIKSKLNILKEKLVTR